MGAAAGPLAAASAGINAIGSIIGGHAQADASRAQAQIAKNNAAIAMRNADLSTAEGDIEVTGQQLRNRAVLGSTKAAQGANGLDVNSGSAVDVRASEAALGQMDALTIRARAAREAYGYQTQAQDLVTQSKLLKTQAKYQVLGGYLDAAGSLLSGASSVSSKFQGMQQPSNSSQALWD